MANDRDEVERLIEELRLIGCHSNGDARCTCGIGMDAADTIAALREKLEAAERNNARWQNNSRETWEAMQAMRNSINEHVPMPSVESDLLQGPENSIFCAAVAEAVVAALTEARAGQAANWLAGRDAAADKCRENSMSSMAGEKAIRALTPPADLTAALDEHDRRVRDAALEGAARVDAEHNGRTDLAHRIRALMGEPGQGGEAT